MQTWALATFYTSFARKLLCVSRRGCRADEVEPGGSTFLIVDAQSVRNNNTAGQKGYDPGKKVSGIKRHMHWILQDFRLPLL